MNERPNVMTPRSERMVRQSGPSHLDPFRFWSYSVARSGVAMEVVVVRVRGTQLVDATIHQNADGSPEAATLPRCELVDGPCRMHGIVYFVHEQIGRLLEGAEPEVKEPSEEFWAFLEERVEKQIEGLQERKGS